MQFTVSRFDHYLLGLADGFDFAGGGTTVLSSRIGFGLEMTTPVAVPVLILTVPVVWTAPAWVIFCTFCVAFSIFLLGLGL